MDAKALLLNRHSQHRLTYPGPSAEQLDAILAAGSRAPDHAGLHPWEFVVAQEQGLERLGAIYYDAALADGAEGEALARARLLPTRAPMVITVIAKITEHPKVPVIEQHLSAGCALMAMQMMAYTLGLGGVWRTGSYAKHPLVREALGVQGDDEIVGFLYLGTPAKPTESRPLPPLEGHVRHL
ncbi:nitroreductase [Ferrimonas balearica DSM 9799]|uniref:Putative NAD(P)H nitroreductase n=1 Tax=Ferrimonas balearica (strain DSM 9799 / CCM 4581 / KCTC 23876 / PAT) TaxID=550540 RepID=E1SQ11_FERBD|nr:NAD(P)H nitroreductase [Ferrimonas balearica]ADN75806.1 nitroreductase [Ferrimonas balearica DSM 9799]MBW3163700.1 NAD(P)H nitroreductase [Ferrimonas balearica]MBY5979492.1 NAD(P)H nitroreductase [Ferrimonas balearica]